MKNRLPLTSSGIGGESILGFSDSVIDVFQGKIEIVWKV